MKLVFMGTPEFARATLASLCESRHEILAVVTGQDKKAGRGQRVIPTACCREARERGLPILRPASLKSDELYRTLKELEPELFVVAAFRILPPRLFNLPAYGSINIHTSLLPKYRGAAPINWALINGETETGLTSFFLREEVDTGDMILQERVPIDDEDTFDTLHDKLADRSGPFVLRTLDLIESDTFTPLKQDESQASRAPKIESFDAMIDFGFPASNVRNFVRGMATRPGAYTFYQGKKLKVYACRIVDTDATPDTRPGTILQAKKKLVVQCGRSAVELLRVVPDGKKEMDGAAFVNGYRPRPGEVLGDIRQSVKE